MSTLRDIGVYTLAYSGANSLWGLINGAKRRDVILAYHRVLPDNWRETGALVDRTQNYVTASNFKRQLEFLLNRRRAGTLGEIVEGAPNPSFAVTFDDGYEDNFSVARPILNELSIPAAVFVTTEVISGKGCFWWDRLADIFERGVGKEFIYGDKRYFLGDGGALWNVFGEISSRIKRSPKRDDVIVNIENQLGVSADLSSDLYLNWEQVKTLYREGWEIGSHSNRHNVLTGITIEEAHENIDSSVEDIKAYLGAPPRYFAYPNGRPGDFNGDIGVHLRTSGLKGAVTMVGGPVPSDVYDI